MEVRINKEAVSHIKIYDFHEMNYIWCDEKPIKFLWIFNDGKHEEGYWKDGIQSHFNWKIGKEDVENSIDREGVLVEKPRIQICTGNYVIKQKYFESIADAQKYCKGKFPNVNVILK